MPAFINIFHPTTTHFPRIPLFLSQFLNVSKYVPIIESEIIQL